LAIADDGSGFDAAEKSAVGMGLSSMRERIKALGGTLKIRSAAGKGTRVEAALPLQTAGALENVELAA
jgi:signal transduction histidine kinase